MNTWFQKQNDYIKDKITNNINKVRTHNQFIMGPEVKELEEKLADYVGSKYAVGCASGTDALLLSLMAYDVKPGDFIFTTSFSFIATSEVISLLGAIPIFVDINPNTYNIDYKKLRQTIEKYVNNHVKPKGIIAVDMFGLPAHYDVINAIAKKYDMFVIEDAAQSFGATYNNKKAGNLADIGCTSFFPSKPLSCFGDGGMCFTNSQVIYEKLCSLRVHGKGVDKYDNIRVGINSRLDTIQAAVLLAKFDVFEEELKKRKDIAIYYNDQLSELRDITKPFLFHGYDSSWAIYSLLAKDKNQRDKIQVYFKKRGIELPIYYPKPLHKQKVYKDLGCYNMIDLEWSERASERIFSLPIHPYMTDGDMKKMTDYLILSTYV